jgi:hypothetical protein
LYGDGETGAAPKKKGFHSYMGVSRKGFLVQQGSGVRVLTTNAVHCEPTTGARLLPSGVLWLSTGRKSLKERKRTNMKTHSGTRGSMEARSSWAQSQLVTARLWY